MMLPSFNYKTNKSVTFGLIDKNHNFPVPEKKDYKIQILDKTFYILKNNALEDIFNKILAISGELSNLFSKFFITEKYHNFDFNSIFQANEKRKLQLRNVSKNVLNQKIWNKYKSQFKNLVQNIILLEYYLNQPKENLSRVSNMAKIIKWIKNDIEKLSEFIQNYIPRNPEREKLVEKIIKEVSWKELNDFLKFFSQKANNKILEYKVALNPAILNAHNEINYEYYKKELEELKKELEKLEKKNQANQDVKRKFEEEVKAFLNHILYQHNFFQKWEWRTKVFFDVDWNKYSNYYEFTKQIFNRYKNYIQNNQWDNLQYHEKLVLDFLRKNWLVSYIDFKTDEVNSRKWIEIDYEFLNKALNQKLNLKEFKNKIREKRETLKGKLFNLNYLQVLTLIDKLNWQKAELKKQWQNVEKLSEYIREAKWLKNTILKNENNLYWKFIAPKWTKAKTAQKLWQIRTEYLQKQNFDKELKSYTHFGFIVKKWERFFILPFEKEKLIWEKGFDYEKARNLLNTSKNWEYTAYIFRSLTLKWFEKLLFLKDAFNLRETDKFKNSKKIWKQKKYTKNKEALRNLIEFYLEILKTDKAKALFPYLDYEFQVPEKYNSLTEFEKDLLKNSYKVDSFKIDVDENKLVEIDIVDRSFEYNKDIPPRLQNKNDIQLFGKWFFNFIDSHQETWFDKIRLLPEIKIYIRYKLSNWQPKEIKLKNWRKILAWARFYKDIIKANFLFELNPLGIWQNPQVEQKKFLENLKQQKLYYIWIDVWQNELATLWVFKINNGRLVPQEIEVDGRKQKIINLTDLKVDNWKVDNWKIITQKAWKWKSNSDKFRAIKEMFRQILYWQIYLKEILEALNETRNIEETLNKYEGKWKVFPKFKSNFSDIYKQFFPWLEKWLKEFLKNYFKDKQVSNYLDFYNDIFQKLQLAKVINLKDAFSSNFIWVILKILEQYPWILIFEALHTGKTYKAKDEISKIEKDDITKIDAQLIRDFNTYFLPYLLKAVFNKLTKVIKINDNWINISQYVYLNKNYENSIKKWSKEKYWNNGIIFWVDEAFTSQACPVCWKNIYWHLKWEKWEHNMHHCDEPKNCPDIENHISKGNSANCDYHMSKNNYWFDFIKSWDDLAAYNIAKRWYEYFNSLK